MDIAHSHCEMVLTLRAPTPGLFCDPAQKNRDLSCCSACSEILDLALVVSSTEMMAALTPLIRQML